MGLNSYCPRDLACFCNRFRPVNVEEAEVDVEQLPLAITAVVIVVVIVDVIAS